MQLLERCTITERLCGLRKVANYGTRDVRYPGRPLSGLHGGGSYDEELHSMETCGIDGCVGHHARPLHDTKFNLLDRRQKRVAGIADWKMKRARSDPMEWELTNKKTLRWQRRDYEECRS